VNIDRNHRVSLQRTNIAMVSVSYCSQRRN